LSRVIKSGELTHALDPFDAVELIAKSDDHGLPRGDGTSRSTIAQAIAHRSLLMKLVKEELADLIARVEHAADERLEQVELEKARLDEYVEVARLEGMSQGREEGYRAGYEEGQRAALQECQDLLRSARAALEEANAIKERAYDEAKDDLLMLAVSVAHRLVPVAMDLSGAASAILREIIQKAEGAAYARVRVPSNAADELAALDEASLCVPEGLRIEFIPDSTLEPGDVVVETDWGLIDGRMRTRWERIIRGLDLTGADVDESTP